MFGLKLSQKPLVFLFALFAINFTVFGYAANDIKSVRVWPAADNTRVVFDLSNKPEYSYFTLSNPERVVIDFKNSKKSLNLSNVAKNDKRIKKIRTSTAKQKSSVRLVLELNSKYKPAVFALAPSGGYGNRLVVDIAENSVVTKLKKQPKPVVKVAVDNSKQNLKRDIVIGIVAGHGGRDPGSIGPRGTYEKHVTLAIAKKLQSLVNSTKGMKAVMIRSGDYYVHINRRTELARAKKVDFLVSIHADAFTNPKPRGASVWLVSSRRVQSEMAKWLDQRQQKSELLGGGGDVIKSTKDDNLALTLADMSREHTLEVSIGVAKNVLSQLGKVTRLHKSQPQYKSLGVLKSSDIPSMLVETGFISNPTEERNLKSSAHQTKLAKAIHTGIKNYFLDYPLSDSYFASIGYKKHKVSSGESLSVLAQRYNVSISQLKSANNLTSNVVRIGQTLKIPRA